MTPGVAQAHPFLLQCNLLVEQQKLNTLLPTFAQPHGVSKAPLLYNNSSGMHMQLLCVICIAEHGVANLLVEFALANIESECITQG